MNQKQSAELLLATGAPVLIAESCGSKMFLTAYDPDEGTAATRVEREDGFKTTKYWTCTSWMWIAWPTLWAGWRMV